MKGKIILTDITKPVEGMQVVMLEKDKVKGGFIVEVATQPEHNNYHDVEINGKRYFAPQNILKQIAIKYEEVVGTAGQWQDNDVQPYKLVEVKKNKTLPLHPDDWKVAIPIIGHEVEFKEVNKDMYSKHIGPAEIVAKLSLPTPVRAIEDIPKGLRKRYPKNFDGTKPPTETAKLLSEIMEDDQKLGLYDTEETWDDIKTKYKKITNRGILTDEELSLFEFLEDYLPPKRKK